MSQDRAGVDLRPSLQAAGVRVDAMRACLIELRRRADDQGRGDDVAMIDGALAGHLRTELMALVGNVQLTPRQWDALESIEHYRRAWGSPRRSKTFRSGSASVRRPFTTACSRWSARACWPTSPMRRGRCASWGPAAAGP